jgi:hypothetical protein
MKILPSKKSSEDMVDSAPIWFIPIHSKAHRCERGAQRERIPV